MKGFVVFYVNFPGTIGDPGPAFSMVRLHNSDLFKKLNDAGYEIMVVPTANESTRVELVTLPQPEKGDDDQPDIILS